MAQEILSTLSVVLFCICCRQFIKSALLPIPLLVTERPYALRAMRVGKVYKVISWGGMTVFFLVAVALSFYQVFSVL